MPGGHRPYGAPLFWKRSRVEVVLPSIDRRACEPRHVRDNGKSAVAGRANLGGGEQASPSLIERVAKVVPTGLNGLSVDHVSAIVVFDARVNPATASH